MQRRMVRRRTGFTLLELVVVVAVLVSLAGLVLPRLDFFTLKANKGIAASNMSGTSRYIQTYRVLNNVYPDNWDSLMTIGGALWVPGDPGAALPGSEGIDPQLTGGSSSTPPLPADSPHKLTVITMPTTGEYLRSITRMGVAHILDVDAANWTGLPGDAFTVSRALATGSKFATLNTTVSNTGAVTGGDPDAGSIVNHYYPNNQGFTNGIVTDANGNQKLLLVFGLGPRNQIIGQTLQSCPTYANTDHTQYYDHLLVIFEAYSDGTRASLVGVVGGDADLMTDEIGDYFQKD